MTQKEYLIDFDKVIEQINTRILKAHNLAILLLILS